MSTPDTVSIPKDLLRRVMAEVEDLRAAAADHADEADTLRDERDALVRERDELKTQRDRLRTEVLQLRELADELKAHAEAAASRQAAAATAAADAGRAAAEREHQTLRDAYDQSETERRALERTHPVPPTRPAPDRPGPADASDPDEILRRAYVAWCRRGSPLVSRVYLFSAFLREASGGLPTTVRAVFRDRSAAGVAFSGNPSGVEYWLATAGAATAILPQPSNPYEFTELAPVYAGTLTPDRLGSIALARADDSAPGSSDAAFALVLRGHVRPE